MTRARELAELAASYDSGNLFGMKNRIINGAMVIDQRNAGASSTANDGYYLDRWRFNSNQNGKGTVQQNQGSVTPPAGFINYWGFTSNSAYSVLSGDNIAFLQNIEGLNVADLAWGTANASAVTLSFWVRSSLTGTFGGAISNSAVNRSYPFSYTISAANTWTSVSVTIPGDTTGTWLTTNGVGLRVFFSLGMGTTYSGTAGAWAGADYRSATGAVSVVGTNGATFYITGVQLEKGSTATSFDYRPYSTELQLAQRYYQKVSGGASDAFAMGSPYNTTACYGVYFLKVSMRTDPTGSASSTNALSFLSNSTANTATNVQFQLSSENQIEVETTHTGLTAGASGWWRFNGAGWVAFSAEL